MTLTDRDRYCPAVFLRIGALPITECGQGE